MAVPAHAQWKYGLKIALNAVRLPKFEPVNGISWSPRKMRVKDLRQRSGLTWFWACADSCVVFNTGPYTVLQDNSILITANVQSEMGFPSSHQLKSFVASVPPEIGGAHCPVSGCWPSCFVQLCSSWQYLNLHRALCSPSPIAELLVENISNFQHIN